MPFSDRHGIKIAGHIGTGIRHMASVSCSQGIPVALESVSYAHPLPYASGIGILFYQSLELVLTLTVILFYQEILN